MFLLCQPIVIKHKYIDPNHQPIHSTNNYGDLLYLSHLEIMQQ